MKKARGAFGSTTDRVVTSTQDSDVVSLIGSSERREDNTPSYDDWVNQQKSNGWPEWFIRWAFPREQYDGTDDMKGFKNASATFASLFGLGSLGSLWSNGNLSSFSNISTPGMSSQSGFLSGLLGSLGSGFGDVFAGMSSQMANSWLNMKNMEKLIDKQNAYNTPKAQMERFAEAGLNPNLVYGLGSNGNQPTSGSIAPVDFDTSQREARFARMNMNLQLKNFESELQERQSRINVNEQQAELINSQTNRQNLENSLYYAGWYNDQMIKAQQLSTMINQVANDNKRVQFESELKDVEKKLKIFQSQPKYMQELGSVPDAMDFIDALISNLSQRISDYFDNKPSTISTPPRR